MRVAYFGNNLNQGYDFVSLLAQRGISATLFDDQRTYEQDTHHWWTKRKRDESLVEYCDITQNVLCAQKKLSDMPAVQKIYEKAKNYDFLVLREYGPALFSELEGPVKVFWSMGFDLQNLPFLLDIGHPGSNKPVRKWTGIRSFLRMTCRRMGSLFSPSDPFEGKTWAEILQKRQRLGL